MDFGRTYSDLVEAVEREIGGSVPSISVIPQWINMAEAWCFRTLDLDCFRATATGTLASGTRTISLPSDYNEFMALRLSTASDSFFVDMASEDRVVDFDSDDVGEPSFCYHAGNQLVLYPAADRNYSYVLRYRKELPPLSPQEPTNELLERYYDLLLYKTLTFSAPYLYEDARLTTWRSILEEIKRDIEVNQWRRDNARRFRSIPTRSRAF